MTSSKELTQEAATLLEQVEIKIGRIGKRNHLKITQGMREIRDRALRAGLIGYRRKPLNPRKRDKIKPTIRETLNMLDPDGIGEILAERYGNFLKISAAERKVQRISRSQTDQETSHKE